MQADAQKEDKEPSDMDDAVVNTEFVGTALEHMNLDEGTDWVHLSPEQQSAFIKAVESGKLADLVEPWEPWWMSSGAVLESEAHHPNQPRSEARKVASQPRAMGAPADDTTVAADTNTAAQCRIAPQSDEDFLSQTFAAPSIGGTGMRNGAGRLSEGGSTGDVHHHDAQSAGHAGGRGGDGRGVRGGDGGRGGVGGAKGRQIPIEDDDSDSDDADESPDLSSGGRKEGSSGTGERVAEGDEEEEDAGGGGLVNRTPAVPKFIPALSTLTSKEVRKPSMICRLRNTLQHTAAHCNERQYTATHCNALQHTAVHYVAWLVALCTLMLKKKTIVRTVAATLHVALCQCHCNTLF